MNVAAKGGFTNFPTLAFIPLMKTANPAMPDLTVGLKGLPHPVTLPLGNVLI
jgi:hypothetical protein